MNELLIDVYSDVVCPWCYVGKRRLERALATLPHAKALVSWRPFQLNPAMPTEGMERRTYLEGKFGSPDAFQRLEEQVSAAGHSEGIPFAFSKITRTPNTFLAHRLIWYAARKDRQTELVDRLFKGYFEQGADIGSPDTLARLAQDVSLEAGAFLAGEDGVADVRTEEAAGHRLGIRGVPYFVFNRAYGLSGAQPVEQFLAVIGQVQAQDGAVETPGR